MLSSGLPSSLRMDFLALNLKLGGEYRVNVNIMPNQIHHMGSLYDPHILLLARQIPFDLEMHVCVAPYLRIFLFFWKAVIGFQMCLFLKVFVQMIGGHQKIYPYPFITFCRFIFNLQSFALAFKEHFSIGHASIVK